MRSRAPFLACLLAACLVLLPGCAFMRRAGDAATTPAAQLDGKTPLQAVIANIPELAAALAAGNVAGAVQNGTSLWEALGIILGGAVASTVPVVAGVQAHARGRAKAERAATIAQKTRAPIPA